MMMDGHSKSTTQEGDDAKEVDGKSHDWQNDRRQSKSIEIE